MNYIKTLVVKFDLPLPHSDIPKFRGAVINVDENRDDILFHSHDGDELRYAYPLIQYKTINGLASIVAIDAGTDSVAKMLFPYSRAIRIGGHTQTVSICETMACSTNLEYVEVPLRYRITNWMPLNKDNYWLYTKAEDMAERLELLRKMLTGNILSFSKGIGLHLEDEIKVQIQSMKENRPTFFKKQKMMTFEVDFSCNLRLPQYIGLGKGSSSGHGVIRLK